MERRRLSRRDFLRISGSVVAGALLAACNTPMSTEQPSDEEVVDAPQQSAERTQVVWFAVGWDWVPPFVEWANTQLTDIEIVVEQATGNYNENLAIRMGAQTDSIDMFCSDVPLTHSYGFRGWLLPMDEMFSAEEKANWLEPATQAGSYKGQLLAVPWQTSTTAMFVNKSLFEQAGLQAPGREDRWTWEQVVDAAVKLRVDADSDGLAETWGYTWAGQNLYMVQMLGASLGADIVGPDGLKADGYLNSDAWLEALTFYYRLYNDWKVGPQEGGGYPPYLSGNLGMVLGWIPFTRTLASSDDLGFDWDVTLHPYFEGGTSTTSTGSWHLAVNPKAKNREGAIELLRLMTTGTDIQKRWTDDSGTLPANNLVLDYIMTAKKYDEFPDSMYRIYAEQARHNPVPRPESVAYMEIQTIFGEMLSDIRLGTKPEEATSTAVERMESEFEKYQF